jgi:hypothetical protein
MTKTIAPRPVAPVTETRLDAARAEADRIASERQDGEPKLANVRSKTAALAKQIADAEDAQGRGNSPALQRRS